MKLSGYAIGDTVHEIEDAICHLGERRAAAPIGLAPWLAARLPGERRFGIGADGGRRQARRRHEAAFRLRARRVVRGRPVLRWFGTWAFGAVVRWTEHAIMPRLAD